MFVDELVKRVRRGAGAIVELSRGRRRWLDTEHRSSCLSPGPDGGGEHSGLAGAGWADHGDDRPRVGERHGHRGPLAVVERVDYLSVDGDRPVAAVAGGS